MRRGAARTDAKLMAAAELERSDTRSPVKAAAGLVIFLRVPEGAVILGVDGHAAVIAPPMKARLLHTSPCHRNDGTFHRPQSICCAAPHQLNAGVYRCAGGAASQGDVACLVHRDSAH